MGRVIGIAILTKKMSIFVQGKFLLKLLLFWVDISKTKMSLSWREGVIHE